MPKLTFRAWGNTDATIGPLSTCLAIRLVEAYIRDPLCGFDPTIALRIDIFRMMKTRRQTVLLQIMRKELPFNFVGGTRDLADEAKATRKLADRMKAMGFKNITCTLYPETIAKKDSERHQPG